MMRILSDRRTVLFVRIALTTGIAGVLSAQVAPATTALQPDGPEYGFAFSSIVGARTLRNGAVIVVDQTDRAIYLVDWKRSEPQRVSRNGEGPGEYVAPRALFHWLGDSLLVHDIGGSRYLILDPDGVARRAFRGAAAESFAYYPLRATDGMGRLYVEGRGARQEGIETQPILRWSPGSEALDTVAFVRRLLPGSGTAARPGRVTTRPAPFHARDEWGVADDGRVVIVHADSFLVESVAPSGTRTSGPRRAYTPRAVTDADKAEWRERQVNAGRARSITKPGNADPRTGAPTTMEVRIEEPEWAETMPPFLAGGVAVAPDGQVWVTRTGDATTPVVRIEIFDARGVMLRTVTLPRGSSIVGFGTGTVLVSRTDADGLEHLRKYAVGR